MVNQIINLLLMNNIIILYIHRYKCSSYIGTYKNIKNEIKNIIKHEKQRKNQKPRGCTKNYQ